MSAGGTPLVPLPTPAPPSVPLAVRERIAHETLGASALFTALTHEEPKALAYYAGSPWSAEARVEAAARAAGHPRNRDLVADVLLQQNAAWGLCGEEGETIRARIEALRDPSSVAVVTGQQLGLFGGPLYTLYKALTALRLAEQIAAETGRPAVPIFWLADEDHDFAEIQSARFARDGEVVRVAYNDGLPADANRGPVGRVVLGEGIERSLAALAAALPKTGHTPALLDAVRDAYQPGQTMREAFARLMRVLTAGTGLVLMSADDRRLKRAIAPLVRQEIERWAETHEALEKNAAALRSDGFAAQVAVRPVNLFLFSDDGQRLALDPEGGGFALRGTGTRFSAGELLALLDREPERFSPNVVLRPLVQDTLLPTAAYVGGPGEVAYFAQLGPVYQHFGVPMPVVFPRASLTLVASREGRFLDAQELSLADLRTDFDALFRRLALAASDADPDGARADALALLHAAADRLAASARAADPTLVASAEATRAALVKAADALVARIVRAEKRKQHALGDALARTFAALMPGNAPQERVLSPLGPLARYGSGFPRLLADALDLDTRRHDVLDV